MKYCLMLFTLGVLFTSNAKAASSVTDSPRYTIQGEHRVFDRPPYGATGNLVMNPAFSLGTTGWKMTNLTDSRGNPLHSVVEHNLKNWLRINQDVQTGNGKQGLLEQTISIPERLRNSVLEVSFLVSGLFTGFKLSGDGTDFVFDTKIDSGNPERIYYYFHPNGASSFTLSFMKGYPGQRVLGEYFEIAEVAVRDATWTNQSIGMGLPAAGGTLQLAWWHKAWDEKSQHKQLATISKLGGMVRVWLSGELFGTYVTKNNPTKRSTTNLTSQYKNAKTAKIFTGLNPGMVKRLDWFFDAARQHDLKVIVTLFGGFTDNTGNPLSVPQSLEFLDTDTDVGSGFNNLASAIVSRYARYENIVAWELVNEGWSTWRRNYSGYSTSAPYATDRSLSFAGYRAWERSAYLTIKAADPIRPVLLNSASSDALYLLNSDNVCDWAGVSLYMGAIRIFTFSGVPTVFAVYNQKTNSLANGTPLKAYTTGVFPAGIDGSTTYYVVKVAAHGFQIATTPGGTGIRAIGGSGDLYFYSTDGTSLAAFDNVFQRWADFPKPTVVAEMGAPADVGSLYRNNTYQEVYLREGFKRVKKYGFVSGIVFDEFPAYNILWDAKYNLNNAGKIVEIFGVSGKTD